MRTIKILSRVAVAAFALFIFHQVFFHRVAIIAKVQELLAPKPAMDKYIQDVIVKCKQKVHNKNDRFSFGNHMSFEPSDECNDALEQAEEHSKIFEENLCTKHGYGCELYIMCYSGMPEVLKQAFWSEQLLSIVDYAAEIRRDCKLEPEKRTPQVLEFSITNLECEKTLKRAFLANWAPLVARQCELHDSISSFRITCPEFGGYVHQLKRAREVRSIIQGDKK